MRSFVLASCCSLAVAASASASFQGFSADTYQFDPASGKWVLDLYACYSTTADVLLNIYDANIVVTGGFGPGSIVHNDLVGGSWCPQFTTNAECDSFVTIGGQPGFANSTNADPGWGPAGCNQLSIPVGAGWFNGSPPNLQGQAKNVMFHDGSSKIATWIGRFVTTDSVPGGKLLTITASQTNNQGLGTPFSQATSSGNFLFCPIPAPSALAVLGLAGMVRRRRRA